MKSRNRQKPVNPVEVCWRKMQDMKGILYGLKWSPLRTIEPPWAPLRLELKKNDDLNPTDMYRNNLKWCATKLFEQMLDTFHNRSKWQSQHPRSSLMSPSSSSSSSSSPSSSMSCPEPSGCPSPGSASACDASSLSHHSPWNSSSHSVSANGSPSKFPSHQFPASSSPGGVTSLDSSFAAFARTSNCLRPTRDLDPSSGLGCGGSGFGTGPAEADLENGFGFGLAAAAAVSASAGVDAEADLGADLGADSGAKEWLPDLSAFFGLGLSVLIVGLAGFSLSLSLFLRPLPRSVWFCSALLFPFSLSAWVGILNTEMPWWYAGFVFRSRSPWQSKIASKWPNYWKKVVSLACCSLSPRQYSTPKGCQVRTQLPPFPVRNHPWSIAHH